MSLMFGERHIVRRALFHAMAQTIRDARVGLIERDAESFHRMMISSLAEMAFSEQDASVFLEAYLLQAKGDYESAYLIIKERLDFLEQGN